MPMNVPVWVALDVRRAATRSPSAMSWWISNVASETPAAARRIASRNGLRPGGIGPHVCGLKSSPTSSSTASRSWWPKISTTNRRTTALFTSSWVFVASVAAMRPFYPIAPSGAGRRRNPGLHRRCATEDDALEPGVPDGQHKPEPDRAEVEPAEGPVDQVEGVEVHDCRDQGRAEEEDRADGQPRGGDPAPADGGHRGTERQRQAQRGERPDREQRDRLREHLAARRRAHDAGHATHDAERTEA